MELLHGGDITSFEEEYPGLHPLDFSANINPLGMPSAARKALADCADACAHYPDPLCRRLVRALAHREQMPADAILCGNGASDLIWRIVRSLRPRQALLPAPTFADYRQALESVGCAVRYHFLKEENDFALDESILPELQDADIVFLCNPNNPTGLPVNPGLMEQILARCEKSGTILVVDECFLPFLEREETHTVKAHAVQNGNIIVLRAFTKLFAMPGLRLGYLFCSDPALRARMEADAPCWSVSVPAQLCGLAALEDGDYPERTKKLVSQWRRQLQQNLSQLVETVYPSRANYVFFRDRPGLDKALRPRGILLRSCANYPGLKEGYYRAAVRVPEENALLLQSLEEVLRER